MSQYQAYKAAQQANSSGSRADFKNSMSSVISKQPSQSNSRANFAASIKGSLGLDKQASKQTTATAASGNTASKYGQPQVIASSSGASGSTASKYGQPQVIGQSSTTKYSQPSGSSGTTNKYGQPQGNQPQSNPYSSHQGKYDPKGTMGSQQIQEEMSTKSNTTYSNIKPTDNSYGGMTTTQGSGFGQSPNSKYGGTAQKMQQSSYNNQNQFKDHGEDTSDTDDNNFNKQVVGKENQGTFITGMGQSSKSGTSSKQAVYSRVGGTQQYNQNKVDAQLSFGDDSDQNDKMVKNVYGQNQTKTGNSSYYGNNFQSSQNQYGQRSTGTGNYGQQQNQQNPQNRFNYNDNIESVSDTSGDNPLTAVQNKGRGGQQQFQQGFNPDLMVSDDDEQILKKSTMSGSQYNKYGQPNTVDPQGKQNKFMSYSGGKPAGTSVSSTSKYGQPNVIGSSSGGSKMASYSSSQYGNVPNTVDKNSSSKFINTQGSTQKKVSFSNQVTKYTTDKYGRKVPVQVDQVDSSDSNQFRNKKQLGAISEEDSDTLNSRDYLDNSHKTSVYNQKGQSSYGIGQRSAQNAAGDFLNNTYNRTEQQMRGSNIQKSPSTKGGQANITQGYNPSNMYNINPNQPMADPFDQNDDYAKQKKRKPGQQDTDSSNYQFQETDSREQKGESSNKDTFRIDTEDGSASARFRQSSDYGRDRRDRDRRDKDRDRDDDRSRSRDIRDRDLKVDLRDRERDRDRDRDSKYRRPESGRWGGDRDKDKSGIYSDGSFGKSANLRETSKSKYRDAFDSGRGRKTSASKYDKYDKYDLGRSRKLEVDRLSSDFDSDKHDRRSYQKRQTEEEREMEDRRRRRKEKERRLEKERERERGSSKKYERSVSSRSYSSDSQGAEYVQQKDKYGNPKYNSQNKPLMMKVKKDDKKGKGTKDSEEPDSVSEDSFRWTNKQKLKWDDYNVKNPQFDSSKAQRRRQRSGSGDFDQYGRTIYPEGTQFEKKFPKKTPYNYYKDMTPPKNAMSDYEQQQYKKYARNEEYLDQAASAYGTSGKNLFKYNQFAQDEYNKQMRQERDMEKLYVQQAQYAMTQKKKPAKWDLTMENKYNDGFGRTEYKPKKDQEMSAYYDKFLPKKKEDSTSEDDARGGSVDREHYLAKFARKDEEAEKVREVERQQLRDQIKKDRELKNFKKISKVIQFAAFVCPGPMKKITKESDLDEDKVKGDKQISDDEKSPDQKKPFKNWEEEKQFEEKIEKQLRDQGMDYTKILQRIDAEKAKRYEDVKGENKKFAKYMGYEEQLDIVRDELATNKKTHGNDSRKDSCIFDNHAVDYQMFISQMNGYRDKQHEVLFFPSNHSHGGKTFTRQDFLERVRETMVSCDDKWFTLDGGSPVILFYFTGVGGRDKRTRDPKNAFLSFSDGRITYKELFTHLVEMCAELRYVSKNMNTIFLKIFIDACYSGNAADYLNSNDMTRQDFTKRCQRALKNTWVGLYVYTSCQADENSANFGQNGGGKFTSDQFSNFKQDQIDWDYWYWKKYGRKEYDNTFDAGVTQVQNPAYGSKNLFF